MKRRDVLKGLISLAVAPLALRGKPRNEAARNLAKDAAYTSHLSDSNIYSGFAFEPAHGDGDLGAVAKYLHDVDNFYFYEVYYVDKNGVVPTGLRAEEKRP